MLNITTTPHEFTYSHSRQAGNNAHGYYMYHAVTVSNEIIVNRHPLYVEYTTGNSFHHFSYDCPMNKLELDSAFSDKILIDLNNFHYLDFEEEHNSENLTELLNDVQEIIPAIQTVDDLYELYQVLMDNVPRLNDYIDDDVFTDDINDYKVKPHCQDWECIYVPKEF